jgi:ornithine cyclodeaminase/alanine dehydrogenase
MPGYLEDEKAMAAKVVSVFPENHRLNMPAIHAIVVVVDVENGRPLCLLDGTTLTALRTGAASGLATALLAREDAETVTIFGAGLQAQTQLEAVCTVRQIRSALVYDVERERAEQFAEEMEDRLGVTVGVARDPDRAVSVADIICTATTSGVPVFDDEFVRSGTHINAIGVFKPHMAEVPVETVVRARVVVDHLHSVLEEAGDLLIPMRHGLIGTTHILGELGQLVLGKITGRKSEKDITLFKAVGVAATDVATAALVLERSAAMGLGTQVDM